MATYVTSKDSLDKIATAIRSKTNNDQQLIFPIDFIDSLNNISTSYNDPNEFNKTILFIDPLSNRMRPIYSYTQEEFLELAEMPKNPDHSKDVVPMHALGWNWEFDDAKEYVRKYGKLIVGQQYGTTDGNMYYYMKFNQFRLDDETALSENRLNIEKILSPLNYGSYTDAKFRDCPLLSIVTLSPNMTFFPTSLFMDCYNLDYVVVPNGVSVINNGRCFQSCKNLTTIALPSTLTTIGNYAFNLCTNLKNIIIPDNVTEIKYGAFYGCENLNNIIIPNSVSIIESSVFNGCIRLETCVLPSTLTIINSNVFYNCINLRTLSIPATVRTIGAYAFNGCINLRTLSIPATVRTIGAYAFNSCINLVSITLPHELTSLGSNAFSLCYGLSGIITIPNGISEIPEHCFGFCYNISGISFPSTLTKINSGAFSHCSQLNSITLPSTLTFIGSDAFYSCSNLSRIEILASDVTLVSTGTISFDRLFGTNPIDSTVSLYFLSQYLNAYKTKVNWSHYSNQMHAL